MLAMSYRASMYIAYHVHEKTIEKQAELCSLSVRKSYYCCAWDLGHRPTTTTCSNRI